MPQLNLCYTHAPNNKAFASPLPTDTQSLKRLVHIAMQSFVVIWGFYTSPYFLVKFSRLYREERNDGTQSSVKWSCPNIHNLTHILQRIEVDKILDNSCDKRLSKISDLTVVQLREECAMLNLDKTGNKVTFPFFSHEFNV